VEQRLDVRAFAGGDDDGVDLGPRDDRRVVARMKLRAGLLREITRLGRLRIGNREEPDSGMLRREARAQRADAARADNRDAQFLPLDGDFLPRAILSGAYAGGGIRDARCGMRDTKSGPRCGPSCISYQVLRPTYD
jgi:hypothetical protein